MSTLLEVRDERAEHLAALDAILFELGGDVTDEEAAAAIDAWLAEADLPLKEKLDAYATVIRERELKAAARKAEADRIAALARTDENTVKRLKARLQWMFETDGIEKLETERFKFTLASNGGRPSVVLHVPPEALPEWAQRVTIGADTEAIRGELDAGKALDFAEFAPRGRHIRIR